MFIDVRGDGTESRSTGLSTYAGDEVTEPLCTELESATAGAHPDERRTMSTPRLLLEQTLTVAVSDMLLAEAYADELAELPEGAEMSRKETPGVGSLNRRQVEDGVINVARTREGVEIAARMAPAELPPAAASVNAWHSRWTLQTVERRLGPLPENRVIESWSLTASLLPTLPPRDLDEAEAIADDSAYSVRLDEDLLLAGIAKAIDFRAELSPAILAERISNNVGGLGPSGWMLVICMADGSATWGLPQAGASAELLNHALFCSAVETYVP